MYKKTTSTFFNEFGTITNRDHFQSGFYYQITNHSCNQLYQLDQDIVISTKNGIVIIACAHDKHETPKQFILHSEVLIRKGVLFNFMCITQDAEITTSIDLKQIDTQIQLSKEIFYEKIISNLQVKEIYAYYHQTKPPLYNFSGETHQYWELTYVDSGTMDVQIDDTIYQLNPFDLIISAPHQFHSQKVTSKTNCTYLTIIFELNTDNYPQLMNQIFKYNYQTRDLLNEFIRYTNNEQFDRRLNNILIANLNTLLAKLSINDIESSLKRLNKTPQHRNFENQMLSQITKYMEQNIYIPIMIDDVCRQFGISRTTLQNLFHAELNISPKLYINNLKLDIAKALLRENKYNISEISSLLGFSSIQYFSKKFRHRFKISPREYSKSTYN